MMIGVQCPVCGRSFVVNSRGRCKCVAYLIRHLRMGQRIVVPSQPAFYWQDGQ